MEYKESKDFIRCERRGEIYADTGSDYSLPDYNGDIRRILFTDAQVHPSGSFENGESVDFSGIVVYNMIYSDSENRINSVSFSSDYDFTVKCDADSFKSADADISVASYSMRLLGPRKISAKATVASGITLSERAGSSPVGNAFGSGNMPEVRCVGLDVFVSERCKSVEREYADEICRLDGAIADEVSVVYTDAECVMDSAAAEENAVALRGNMRVFAVLKNGDEPLFLVEKNIRIDESVPYEGVKAERRLLPRVSVGSVRPAVNADENGCSVVVSVILDLGAESLGNEKVEVVSDAYRRDIDTANSFDELRYSELVTHLSEREELSASVARDSLEIDNLREVICLRAVPNIESVKCEDGAVCMSGEIRYSGIASAADDDGKIYYHPFKTSVEFNKNVNINCQNLDNLKIEPAVECYGANATIDEAQVYLSASACIKLGVREEKCTRVLTRSEVIENTEFESTGSKITVYYPEAGEELFDIAKKFHTTVEKIAEDNSAAVRAMSGEPAAREVSRKLIIF